MSAITVCCFAHTSLTNQIYKIIVNEGSMLRSVIARISAVKHGFRTMQNKRIYLSAFDVKRLILEDGISCLPFGQFEVRDIPELRSVVKKHDRTEISDSEEETLTNILSPNWSRIFRDPDVSLPERFSSLLHFNVAEDSIGVDESIILSR